MIETLKPVWKQFEETEQALRLSLGAIADANLTWSPGGEAMSVARQVQHTAAANLAYVRFMEGSERRRTWEFQDAPSREWLVERLDESKQRVLEVFEAMTDESLTRPCADDWAPLDDEQLIEGPLDALWFALQVMRHTAYHLGQLNVYRLVFEAHSTQ